MGCAMVFLRSVTSCDPEIEAVTMVLISPLYISLTLGYLGFALAMAVILLGITLERYLEPQQQAKLQKFSRKKNEKME